jgi:hypothetical protein
VNGNVVPCGLFEASPFLVPLYFIEGKREYSIYKESIGCKLVLERMIGMKDDGGVCHCRLAVNV